MDVTVKELKWVADHSFTGTYGPGYLHASRDASPLRRLLGPLLVGLRRAQHGHRRSRRLRDRAGAVFPELEKIYDDVAEAAGSTDTDDLFAHAGAVSEESLQFFFNFLNRSVDPGAPCGR